jgi:hypothetical protein
MSEWLMDLVTITSGSSDALFWESPVGFATVFLITATALITIFSKRMNADCITIFYNWVLIIISAIAMMHVAENTNPKHQLQIILVALAIKKAWDVYQVFRHKLDYRRRA